jgi:DNA-binding NtrC family response regulator
VDKILTAISNAPEPSWLRALEDALAPLARVQVATEAQAQALSADQGNDLLLLDTASIGECVVDLIDVLRAARPGVPVVVATTSPTWQRARQALRAGASDYIRKSLDPEKILADLEPFLRA